ncbi:MAG: hypothetical protein HY721_02715 [Planctomycetes bacterium]|nr:hypothetical protein [Planctomycetota bacterium]
MIYTPRRSSRCPARAMVGSATLVTAVLCLAGWPRGVTSQEARPGPAGQEPPRATDAAPKAEEAPAAEKAPEPEAPAREGPAGNASGEGLFGIPIHGFLSARYRARFTGSDGDQDLFQTLSFDIGAPERHRVTAHFLGRLSEDIDGSRDSGRSFVFDSITDTYKSNVNGRLYHAYLDVHRVPLLETIRLGRQVVQEAPVIAYFDGGRLETAQLFGPRLQLGGYGGLPVHLFESSPAGDALAGAYAQARPWKGGKARLDWMHARDDVTLGVEQDDLFGAALWQDLGELVQLHGAYTFLDDRSRDVVVRGTFQQPDWDLRVQGSYYELLERQRDLALELDPFFSAVFERSPYRQTRWVASKGFGEHYLLEAGFDLRRLKDGNDEGDYNRELERYFLTPSAHDLFAKGLGFSLTGELWDSGGRLILSAGADASYKLNDRLRASVGSFYSLYRYDYFADRERDHVQTYYVKLGTKLTKNLKSDLEYDFEDDEFEEYHVLRVGLTLSF